MTISIVQLRREQELARLRADFTSSVSHELRTPLAQILLFAETLSLGRARSDGERRGAAEIIVQGARRLMHLVENVLHVSRAERRTNRIVPAPLAFAPAIRDVLAAFAPLARSAGVEIQEELDEALTVPADRDALRQILLNLLDNGVKYAGDAAVITVGSALVGAPAGGDSGESGEARARIWVEDHGPGIVPADRERVWRPFVRLDRTADHARTGSGIGLAVVRELVALHGGSARVEGSASGSGARFVLELPGAYANPSARDAPAPGGDGARSSATREERARR